jgi:hypothetical protein
MRRLRRELPDKNHLDELADIVGMDRAQFENDE